MCWFTSCCTQEMDSRPPATSTSFSPAMMRCAASAIDCRPEEQKRLMVMPDVVTGRPARVAIKRATLPPVVPSGSDRPMMTSSTSAPSMPARCTACCTAWAPSVGPYVILNEPFQLLASGVRAVETITADVIASILQILGIATALQANDLPSAAKRANRGAGFQNAASSLGFCAKRFMACTTLIRPCSLA